MFNIFLKQQISSNCGFVCLFSVSGFILKCTTSSLGKVDQNFIYVNLVIMGVKMACQTICFPVFFSFSFFFLSPIPSIPGFLLQNVYGAFPCPQFSLCFALSISIKSLSQNSMRVLLIF